LAGWVNSLASSARSSSAAAQIDQTPARMSAAETFAANRTREDSDHPTVGTEAISSEGARPRRSAEMPIEGSIPPPARSGLGRGTLSEEQKPGDPEEFPLPFVITGTKPKLAPTSAAPKAGKTAASSGSTSKATRAPVTSATARGGSSGKPESVKGATGPPEKDESQTDAATTNKTSKPLKLDPKILERALQLRNQNRQQSPSQ
jgi:hypothetical protein